MFRSFGFVALVAPALSLLLWVAWGDTFALFVGVATPGAQARYFPPPPARPGRHRVELLGTRRVVPSADLPAGVTTMMANNNLDVARHDGRVFLAWRTAPDHFATDATVIQVVSSADERGWQLEQRVHLGTDLREPRFLSLNGSLFLYMSKLGTNRMDFEPKGVLMSERRPDGTWTAAASLGLPGYIVWRTRVVRGRAYMLAYSGGAGMYQLNGAPLHVDLLTSDDGRDWRPADPEHRSVYVGGGSEADFTLDDEGRLYGVIRNEAGDQSGLGSLVCTAPPGHLAEWDCRHDPRKFDSPYVFFHDGDAYVLARRNVAPDGAFDLEWGPGVLRRARDQLEYLIRAKRCALWRFTDHGWQLLFVRDLPSRGDTCFPAVLQGPSPNDLVVYDYSSPIDGPDSAWSVGQRGPTYIYRHALEFVDAGSAAEGG